ncbi:MAG TPA: hypothetical protein VMD58_00450 [Acidobacteriaceae bacterium]|nr:hypothetical protein [Acidobacteriaceae bacterium]
MGERSPDTLPSTKEADDRLDSWKEIAAYLNRDVTTVQRWEKREGMPVHRHQHDRMGSVFASRVELDAWTCSRSARAAEENGNSTDPSGASGSALSPESLTLPKGRTRWRLILLLAAAVGVLIAGAIVWLSQRDFFWRNPIADARFQTVTDFSGVEEAAAISRDGQFVAFLSDRDGPMDVWVTQVGSGQFHNLTHGSVQELVNPSIRTLGFSPDGSLVTFWVRKPGGKNGVDISVWAVPTLGGEPKPYLEGVAEYDWSRDGSRLAYHTPGPGDPLYVSNGVPRPSDRRIFMARAGLHSHFPLWSPHGSYIYFVQGSLPDKLDIWRIPSSGGTPERITSHNTRVIYPVMLNGRTLMYLASNADGAGPWLYSMDVEHRIPHRLTFGVDRYTSLAASADGRRLVLTAASSKGTLWRLRLSGSTMGSSDATPTPLMAGQGFSPRLCGNSVVYVAENGPGESVRRLSDGVSRELWNGGDSRIIGSPAISPDQRSIAFSVIQHGKRLLYAMLADGSHARVVADTLNLEGSPAWAPDGKSITSAVLEHGVSHLFRIPLDGQPPASIVREYSLDPAWEPGGRFVVYSGPDIGTTFTVKAVTPESGAHPLRTLTLTRGARHVVILPGGHAIVVLQGEIEHKNL